MSLEEVDALLHPLDEVIDVQQVIHALRRARDRLQHEADVRFDRLDYDAEFFSEDAQRMREAIALLGARG